MRQQPIEHAPSAARDHLSGSNKISSAPNGVSSLNYVSDPSGALSATEFN
jgi:hypothetical protein